MKKYFLIIILSLAFLCAQAQKTKKINTELELKVLNTITSPEYYLTVKGDTVKKTPVFNADTLICYLGFNDSVIVIPLTQNVPAKFNDSVFNISYNAGFTIQADSVQIPKTGVYNIDLIASFSGNNGDQYHGNLYLNGSMVTGGGEFQRTMTNASKGTAGINYTASFTQGDWLTFRFTNTANNNDATINTFNWRISAVKATFVYQVISGNISIDSVNISSSNILNADSILIKNDCDNIDWLKFTLNSGTDYVNSGNDSTILYVKYEGVNNKCAIIPNDWYTSTTQVTQKLHFDCTHDLNSPLWLKIATGFTTGTRSQTVTYSEDE